MSGERDGVALGRSRAGLAAAVRPGSLRMEPTPDRNRRAASGRERKEEGGLPRRLLGGDRGDSPRAAVVPLRRSPEDQWVRAVYSRHGVDLYRFALRAVGDRGLAEEVVQDVMVRAWRAADRYDASRGSLSTWLFTIARNVVIDALRARGARPASPASAPEGSEASHAEDVVRKIQVSEAFRTLSDVHRQVLLEVYYRDRPYADLAAELGVPVGTLRSRVFYALRAMRAALEERGWSE